MRIEVKNVPASGPTWNTTLTLKKGATVDDALRAANITLGTTMSASIGRKVVDKSAVLEDGNVLTVSENARGS